MRQAIMPPINFVQQYMRQRNSGHLSLGALQLLLGFVLAAASVSNREDDSALGCLCLGLTLLSTGAVTMYIANKSEGQIEISWAGRDPNPYQISYQRALGIILITVGLACFTAGHFISSFRAGLWGAAIGAGLNASFNQSYAIGRWDEESERLREAGRELREYLRQEDRGYTSLGVTKLVVGLILLMEGILGLTGIANMGSDETAAGMVSLSVALMAAELFGLAISSSKAAMGLGLSWLLVGGLAGSIATATSPMIRAILLGVAIGYAFEATTNLSYVIGRWDEQKLAPENAILANYPQPSPPQP